MENLIKIFLWIFFFIFLIDFIFLIFWSITLLKNKTLFIPVSKKNLPDIDKVLDIKENSVVYDLGSGDGRILFYLSKKYKDSNFVGIENNPFPFSLYLIQSFFTPEKDKKNIKVVRNDIFKENLSEATHIIAYLHPFTMDDLLPKLDSDLKKGTKFISINYRFTTKRPLYEIDLNSKKFNFTKRIYVYEF